MEMTDHDLGLRKRSLTIARHRTSLALEPIFWRALDREASERQLSLAGLIGEIDQERAAANAPVSLASASRVHVVDRLMKQIAAS
ncbi:MAG: ribbon-helix-helix domain-containing protein [Pseudomonadota bacterium]